MSGQTDARGADVLGSFGDTGAGTLNLSGEQEFGFLQRKSGSIPVAAPGCGYFPSVWPTAIGAAETRMLRFDHYQVNGANVSFDLPGENVEFFFSP